MVLFNFQQSTLLALKLYLKENFKQQLLQDTEHSGKFHFAAKKFMPPWKFTLCRFHLTTWLQYTAYFIPPYSIIPPNLSRLSKIYRLYILGRLLMPHTYATSTVHEYKFDGVEFLFTCLRQTKLAKKCNEIKKYLYLCSMSVRHQKV